MDHYYDTIAPSYNELYGDEQMLKLKVIDEELKRLNITLDGLSLLDVGCGTGISTAFFNNRCHCTGIDPSKGLLDLAKKGPKYILAEAEKLPFNDNSFDIIISLTSIQNFNDLEKATDEMRRVLNRGFLIISFLKRAPNKTQIERALRGFEKLSIVKETKDIIYFLKI